MVIDTRLRELLRPPSPPTWEEVELVAMAAGYRLVRDDDLPHPEVEDTTLICLFKDIDGHATELLCSSAATVGGSAQEALRMIEKYNARRNG